MSPHLSVNKSARAPRYGTGSHDDEFFVVGFRSVSVLATKNEGKGAERVYASCIL
jgi:hypothetical protein